MYIDLLYHHRNCERESILQLNLICENKKHLIIFVKKNILQLICERNILHSWRQTRLCTINLLFSKNNLLAFTLFEYVLS